MSKISQLRKLAYSALLVNALIWGAAFPIIKPVFDHINPMQYLYFRFLAAGILALPIFFWYYIKVRPKISYTIKVLLIELFGLPLPLWLLYTGLDQTSALEASILSSLTPLFVTLGGIYFLKEKETKREWQGLGLALVGSLLIVLEPLLNGHSIKGSSLSGNLYILGYNLIYTIYVIIAKKVYKKKPPVFFGALTYLATAAIYAILLNNDLPKLDLLTNPQILLPVLYMAIPGGIIAFALYLYSLSQIEASEANLFTYLNGVVAIPAAAILLQEYPTPLILTAITLITYGVFRAESRKNML